jgi:hypothetical protein
MSKARDLANIGTTLATVSTTELGYVDGVTSAIQTQLDAKAPSSTAATLTGTQTLTNKTLTSPVVNVPQIKTPKEVMNISATALSGTNGLWSSAGTFFYYTVNATANATVNFVYDGSTTLNSIMAVGDALTYSVLMTNGATPYYISAVQIDGSAVTPKYSGGTAPASGNASSIDAYSYTIVKTAATPTYTVFAAGPVKYA